MGIALIDKMTAAEWPIDESGDRCAATYLLHGVFAYVLRVSVTVVWTCECHGADA